MSDLSLIYLDRGNTYALVRPDGIVHLTLELTGTQLAPPANDPPFFTFEGTLSPHT